MYRRAGWRNGLVGQFSLGEKHPMALGLSGGAPAADGIPWNVDGLLLHLTSSADELDNATNFAFDLEEVLNDQMGCLL